MNTPAARQFVYPASPQSGARPSTRLGQVVGWAVPLLRWLRLYEASSPARFVRPVATQSESEEPSGGGAATADPVEAPRPAPRASPAPRPKQPPTKQLPPWKVLLHNDDNNSFEHVILTILELTPLTELAAVKATEEAHKAGTSLLLVTHKERAELFVEQFQTKSLTVTIEPAE